MAKNTWVITVAEYGGFFLEGTEKSAEEMRQHKANQERGIGRKRLADDDEVVSGKINPCLNHPNFYSKLRYRCECLQCKAGA